MSPGVRSVALSVAVIALSAASPKSVSSPPGAADQKVVAALENVASALKQQPNAAKTGLPCGKREENRSSDLCAQWKAADAAKSAADAAWTLGIAGSILGFFTLLVAIGAALYARDAARYTQAGAIAADKSLVETRDVAAAELRPWLVPEPSIEELEITDGGFVIRYTVRFRNAGKTSAARFYADLSSGFLGQDDSIEQIEARYAEWETAKRYMANRTLMPGEEFVARAYSSHNARFIPWIDWSDGTRRASFAIVAACVYWSEIGRQWHRTERAFVVGEKGGKSLLDFQLLRESTRGTWDAEGASKVFTISQYWAGETT
jgi:hypothetical protein